MPNKAVPVFSLSQDDPRSVATEDPSEHLWPGLDEDDVQIVAFSRDPAAEDPSEHLWPGLDDHIGEDFQ